jgi:MFS family permease
MVGETFPPARRGRYGAVAQSGAPCGLGAAAAICSFLAPAIGWRTTFLLSVAPVVALSFLRAFPESDLWLEHRRHRRAGTLARSEREAARRPILAQLVGRDLRGRFAGAFLLTILNMSSYWFAVIWLPRYLQVQRGLSVFGSGWWTLTFVAGSLLGYLTFGAVSDAIPGGALSPMRHHRGGACGRDDLLEGVQTEARGGAPDPLRRRVGTGTWSCFGAYFTGSSDARAGRLSR